jgi:hypothetical protein
MWYAEAKESKGKPSSNRGYSVSRKCRHAQAEKTLTEISKRPRPEDNTPMESVRPPKKPRDSSGAGAYKEELTNIWIAIFKENRPENMLLEDNLDQILEGVPWDSKDNFQT